MAVEILHDFFLGGMILDGFGSSCWLMLAPGERPWASPMEKPRRRRRCFDGPWFISTVEAFGILCNLVEPISYQGKLNHDSKDFRDVIS